MLTGYDVTVCSSKVYLIPILDIRCMYLFVSLRKQADYYLLGLGRMARIFTEPKF